jgi:hypothetical protein
MKPAPMFVFACAVAALSGAVGGAAIDTTPIQRAGIGTPDFLREPSPFDPSAELLTQAALPDHYEMLTPTGRVEVAELTTYGLRSQRRFGWSEPSPLEALRPITGEPQAEDSWRRTEEVTELVAPETVVLPSVAGDVAPPVSEANTASTGTARTINVAAALAGA